MILSSLTHNQWIIILLDKDISPSGGQGKFAFWLVSASRKTFESWALSFRPEYTYVNSILKSHMHITFCVMVVFLLLHDVCLSAGTHALICVPSIAPIQFWYKNMIETYQFDKRK